MVYYVYVFLEIKLIMSYLIIHHTFCAKEKQIIVNSVSKQLVPFKKINSH